MKRIVALLVALTMLFAISLPVMAETVDTRYTSITNAKEANTTLVYGVSQTYAMKIPSEVKFAVRDGSEGLYATATIEAGSVVIAGDQKLNVAIAAKNREAGQTSAEDQWYLVDTNTKADGTPASDKVKYYATIEGSSGITKLSNGSIILTVNPPVGDQGTVSNAGGKVDVSFFTKGTAQHGNFKDELTFRVSVDKDKA